MVRRALLLSFLALAAPTAAGAATLTVTYSETAVNDRGVAPTDLFRVHVTGTGGDADSITFDDRHRVRDDGPSLQPGPSCSVAADGWGECTPRPHTPGHSVGVSYEVATGAGDDVVTEETATFAVVDLGAGDDSASVDDSVPFVAGGAGADRVRAVGARLGRPMAEVTFDGGPGPDTASGSDLVVTYRDRTAGVRVTPDGIADDGEAGEGDQVGPDVYGIEGGHGDDEIWSSGGSVQAGAGNDRIVGLDGPRPGVPGEGLYGEAGDDVVDGRGGDDTVDGGVGNDVLRGGPGNDQLSPHAGRDAVEGGPGDDEGFSRADGSPDTWSGGAGRDTWLGGSARGPLVISLDGAADDGLRRERDNVHGDWERVGIYDGTLIGSPRADELQIFGRGSIFGRGGDDVLLGGIRDVGGPGRDLIRPAAHARIDVRDGRRDVVRCGRGPARAVRRDRADRVSGC